MQINNLYIYSFKRERERVESSPEFSQRVSPFEEIIANIRKLTGKELRSIVDMWIMYHEFLAMKAKKEPIPEWAEDYMPKLLDAAYLTYDLYQFNDWMKKMNGGTYFFNNFSISIEAYKQKKNLMNFC